MKITESQFIEIIKTAFIHGITCAPFFPHPFGDEECIFTKKEQSDKIDEVVKACRCLTTSWLRPLRMEINMISQSNNFCRIFELPDCYPKGCCFGGGHPVTFKMVDWFNPIPSDELENMKPWQDYIPLLKEFLKDKLYVKPGKQYLLITDFGESMLFSPGTRAG